MTPPHRPPPPVAPDGYVCLACGAVHEAFDTYCVSCGRARGLQSRAALARAATRQAAPAVSKYALGPATGDQGYRIKTGFAALDRVFGKPRRGTDADAGIHVPSVAIVAGAPGCGKTTLILWMMAVIVRGNPRLKRMLVSSEQTHSELADNIHDMGLERELADLPVIGCDEGGDDWAYVKEALAEEDPRLVVIDSHNKMRDSSADTADREANSLRLLTDIRVDAFEKKRAMLVIAHLNKKMEMRGTKELEHDVSALMMIFKEETKARTLVRAVCPTKNRFGKTGIVALFEMGDEGMRELDPEEIKREEDQRRRDRALDRELGTIGDGPGGFAPREPGDEAASDEEQDTDAF